MELFQVRYFLAWLRTLNFTRAAEACGVSQPALTRAIQRLEEELGGPLLHRERNLTQLSALGRAMLPLSGGGPWRGRERGCGGGSFSET